MAILTAMLGCDRSAPAALREPVPSAPQTAQPSASVRPAWTDVPSLAQAGQAATRALRASDLCVSSGKLLASGGALAVESPEFRAVATRSGDTDVELRFTYAGPTAEVAELGSGRVRRQIGLKLRAQDPCNLVYAMWRIDPGPELAVQVKLNPGQRTSSECKNGGYRTVRPVRSAPAGPVAEGSSHVLRASLRGATLALWADGVLAWEGMLGDDAQGPGGPVGLRSDNARFTFTMAVAGGDGQARPCGE
jgi:hypothetical protein